MFDVRHQFVFTIWMKVSPALDISPAPTTSSVAPHKELQFTITRLYPIVALHSIMQFCNITLLHAGIDQRTSASIVVLLKS